MPNTRFGDINRRVGERRPSNQLIEQRIVQFPPPWRQLRRGGAPGPDPSAQRIPIEAGLLLCNSAPSNIRGAYASRRLGHHGPAMAPPQPPPSARNSRTRSEAMDASEAASAASAVARLRCASSSSRPVPRPPPVIRAWSPEALRLHDVTHKEWKQCGDA